MDELTIIALIDAILEDRISDIVSSRPKRGLRGFKGRDFSFEDHSDVIFNQIEKYVQSNKLTYKDLSEEEKDSLKLKFLDLTESEVASLRGDHGVKGERGLKGHKGEEGIQGETGSNGLQGVKGVKGERGLRGLKGDNFYFDDHQDKIAVIITSYVEFIKKDLKLKFENLSEEEAETLKGEKGSRGQRGKPFKFEEHEESITNLIEVLLSNIQDDLTLKFKDLSDDERESLKMRFSDLSEEDKEHLKGEKGSRGQRGKSVKGDRGVSFFSGRGKPNSSCDDEDLYLNLDNGDIHKWEANCWTVKGNIKGARGESVRGVPGLSGATGPRGFEGESGRDGIDAIQIAEISLETLDDSFYFIFKFSNGEEVETNRVSFPEMKQIVNTFVAAGGSVGGGLSIERNGVALGTARAMNFAGSNINLDFTDGVATVSIDKYDFNDLDEEGDITYVGESSDALWRVKKLTEVGKDLVMRYANENNNAYTSYADAWTNRLTLTYDLLENI